MILYKYRQNSTYTDQIFTDGKVWLAKSSTLNDPCECTLHTLAPDWIAQQVREMKSAQMAGAIVGMPGRQPDRAALKLFAPLRAIEDFEAKYQMFRKLYEESYRKRLSDPELTFGQLEEQLKSVGVFSLSEVPDHPLMWSHYGGNHEGVCLGFEVADGMPISDRDRFIKVAYTDQIPKMEGGFRHEIAFYIDEQGRPYTRARIPFSDETLRAAISTKAVCWEYEREWRYIEAESGAYAFPGPLVEIVFGLRCSPEQRQRYLELAATHLSNDVRLFEIRRIPNTSAFERVFLGVCHSHRAPGPVAARPRLDDDTSVHDKYPAIQSQMDHGQFAQALPGIEEALNQEPDSPRLWRAKGVVLGNMLRHADALECFERASELAPSFFSAWYHQGVACTALNRYDGAISAYREAHRLNSSDASTSYNLGCVLAHLGNLEEAKANLLAAEASGHARARDLIDEIDSALAKTTEPAASQQAS